MDGIHSSMPTSTRMLPTVRDSSGAIYADIGNSQVRKIPSLEEYQAGVQSGIYSGTPRAIAAAPLPGAGGQTYLGGYEVGADPASASEFAAGGSGNFATSSRTIGGNATASPAGKAGALKASMAGIISGTGGPAAAPAAAPTQTYAQQIAAKRQEAARLQTEAFMRSTEYTPDELKNLTPGQQAELRRQRVTAIAGQLGNVQAAIQTIQDEETRAQTAADKERTNSLDTLNTYLKYGALDSLSPEAQQKLATSAGLDMDAFKKIAEVSSAGEPPELKEVGGSLYAVSWNAETGKFDTQLVVQKPAGSGSGSGSGAGGEYDGIALSLLNGDITVADVVAQYKPDVANAIISRANEMAAGAESDSSSSAPESPAPAPRTPGPAVGEAGGPSGRGSIIHIAPPSALFGGKKNAPPAPELNFDLSPSNVRAFGQQ